MTTKSSRRFETALSVVLAVLVVGGLTGLVVHRLRIGALNDRLRETLGLPEKSGEVRRLIDSGADPRIRDANGRTTLFAAAHDGDAALCRRLIRLGVDPNVEHDPKFSFSTALDMSIVNGHVEATRALLDGGARKASDGSPAATAAFCGQVEILKELDRRGWNIVSAGETNCPPLHSAIECGQVATVKFLFSRGASANGRGPDGCTPLQHSPPDDSPGVLKYLQMAGADFSAVDKHGKTVAHELVGLGRTPEFAPYVRLAIQSMRDVDARNSDGDTVLKLCSHFDLEAAAKLLLRRGASVEAADREGATPLMICESAEMADLLLRNGAKVASRDRLGRTSMHHAALVGNPEVIKALLRRGAEINAPDNKGATPLAYARACGESWRIEVVENLLRTSGAVIRGYVPRQSAWPRGIRGMPVTEKPWETWWRHLRDPKAPPP